MISYFIKQSKNEELDQLLKVNQLVLSMIDFIHHKEQDEKEKSLELIESIKNDHENALKVK